MTGEYPRKEDEETTLFDRRRRSTELMAIFNRRYINNLRKNWEIKQKDHLLPDIKTIFEFIEKDFSEVRILRDPSRIKDWWEVVRDEDYLEEKIQENIAILSWVYWQRLEGYEILDVSIARERLVEDIGSIQQFYNAADGLILEYQRCFRFQKRLDILCVYGLYQHYHTNLRHFIMVPNQTRYDFIPAWISVAHEVAHIAIEEIDNEYYAKWKELERIRRLRTEIKESKLIEEEYNPEFIRKQLRKGWISLEDLGIFDILKNSLAQILSVVEEDKKRNFLELLDRIISTYSNIASADTIGENYISFCKFSYEDIKRIDEILENIRDILKNLTISEDVLEKALKELSGVEFNILSMREAILEELISKTLLGNPESGKVDQFFSDWKKIKRYAADIAETVMHVIEGESRLYSFEHRESELVYTYEHLLADIIATFIAGEFYLYSLAFYRFLPSAFLGEDETIRYRQRVPMSLRFFICLETLKYSSWKEMKSVINRIEKLWNKKALGCSDVEGIDDITKDISDDVCKKTAELSLSLIESIIDEDSRLEKEYANLLKEAERGTEESKEKIDESYFNYMRHALGYALRSILGNPNGFLLKEGKKENSLKVLIELVRDVLIDDKKLFTVKERYETIKRIKEDLRNGILILDSTQKDPEHKYTPRSILSAYAQIYFENVVGPEKNRYDYVKVFNATVTSMAWTQYSLERFYDGNEE